MRGESFRNNIRNRKEREEEMIKYPRIINNLSRLDKQKHYQERCLVM